MKPKLLLWILFILVLSEDQSFVILMDMRDNKVIKYFIDIKEIYLVLCKLLYLINNIETVYIILELTEEVTSVENKVKVWS